MKAQMPPGTTFTTLALNFNTPMQCHRDSNNKPGEKAYLMGFGNYVGGQLWCHGEKANPEVAWNKVQGRWLPGQDHATYHKLVSFDPRCLHQPQPWEGNRITLSAYTVNCDGNCSQANRELLQALGFPLPQVQVRASPEGGGAAGGMKSLRRSKGALRALCGAFAGARCGCSEDRLGPGEDQTLESHQVVGGEGQLSVRCALVSDDQDSLVPGEDQTLESPQVVGGEGRDVFLCSCKGYEVGPSLCVCKGYEVDPSLSELHRQTQESGPQVFYIGDRDPGLEGSPESSEVGEDWGVYAPPEVRRLVAAEPADGVSYSIVGSEVPLQVGWDLLGEYADVVRMALIQEEYMERDHLLRQGEDGEVCQGPLSSWISARCELEASLTGPREQRGWRSSWSSEGGDRG